MEEGGASCPAGERGRTRFCLGAVQHHVLQGPRLTVTSCLSDIVALKADVSTCMSSGVQATSMWQVRVKGGGGRTLPECASLPDQDLRSRWMICYLCCTCVTALCTGTKYLITPNCISVVTAVWTRCLLASKIMWGVKLTSASLRDVKFIVGIQFSSHNWTLSHLYPFFKLKFSFLIKADSSRV